jgi:hypothetical protein
LGVFREHCGGFWILDVEIGDLDNAVVDLNVSHEISSSS